jgi:hypothetical protein
MARNRTKYSKGASQQPTDDKPALYRIKGVLRMKYLAPVLSVFLGAGISGWVAYHIFQKQLLVNQYAIFAEDLAEAASSAYMWKATASDDSGKQELKARAELYFNRAWSRALVTLPDEVFLQIDGMIAEETINPEKRNKLFHSLRQELYPKTTIDYETIKARQIHLDVKREN